MFDIGWSELLLVGVIALIAVGPKELPSAIYQLGRWIRQARGLAREFQSHVDDLMNQAEIEELRKQATKNLSPLDPKEFSLTRMAEDIIDHDGSVRGALESRDALPAESGETGSSGSPPEIDEPEVETDDRKAEPVDAALPASAPAPMVVVEPSVSEVSTPDKTA